MTINNTTEAMLLLVDSAAGIYAYNSLVNTYPLFVGKDERQPLADFIVAQEMDETAFPAFHPDNVYCFENIEHAENSGLYVEHTNGELWEVRQLEGDIFAINPYSTWSEYNEAFVMPNFTFDYTKLEPCFELSDGVYYIGIDLENMLMASGTMCNTGFGVHYITEYDDVFSLDENLQQMIEYTTEQVAQEGQ